MKYLEKMNLVRPCTVVLDRFIRRETHKIQGTENSQNLDANSFSVSSLRVDGKGRPGQRSEKGLPIQESKYEENHPFQCSICWEKYSVAHKLQKHYELTHERNESPSERAAKKVSEDENSSREKPVVMDGRHGCSFCDKRFVFKTFLEIHEKEHTDGDKPFGCWTCPQRFMRKCELEAHGKIHISGDSLAFQKKRKERRGRKVKKIPHQSPDKCLEPSPNKTRERSNRLSLSRNFKDEQYGEKDLEDEDQAMQREMGEKIMCEKDSFVVQNETKVVDGLEKRFKCNFCDIRFKRKAHRNIHETIHTGEKPFKCGVCSRAFARRDYLIKHERLHTGEKPYKCGVCSKAFKQKQCLTTHKGKYHNGETAIPISSPINDNSIPAAECSKHHLQSPEKSCGEETPYYKCDVCNKGFTWKHSLKIHKMIHTDEDQVLRTGEEMMPLEHGRELEQNLEIVVLENDSNSFDEARNATKVADGFEKPTFQCNFCDKRFKWKYHRNDHERIHTGEKPYQCGVCSEAFMRGDYLRIHEALVHSSETPHKCEVCGEEFKLKSYLLKHKRVHTKDGTTLPNCTPNRPQPTADGPFESGDFDEKSTQNQEIPTTDNRDPDDEGNVMQMETEVVPEIGFNGFEYAVYMQNEKVAGDLEEGFKCNVCNKLFKQNGNRMTHERILTGDRPYQCSVCDKAFRQMTHLRNHHESLHSSNPKPYKCGVCSREFIRKEHLTRHETAVHSSDTPHKCGVCNEVFKLKSYLQEHKRMHTKHGRTFPNSSGRPTGSFNIGDCEYESKQNQEIHERIETSGNGDPDDEVHVTETEMMPEIGFNGFEIAVKNEKVADELEKGFKCNFCNKLFKAKRYRNIHERIHTGEKPYKCGVCSRAFVRKKHLTTHERIHTREKPYQCGVCTKAFRRKHDLRKHEVVHSSDPKPYKCGVCSREFIRKQRLTKHERIHMEEKPYQCGVCSEAFMRGDYLRKHEALVHSSETPHKCEVRGEEFKSKSYLLKHERVHTKDGTTLPNRPQPTADGPFESGECDEKSTQNQEIPTTDNTDHDDEGHVVQMETEMMPEIGFNGFEIAVENEKVADELEEGFKCTFCNKLFKRDANRMTHERIHTRDRPYQCGVCDKAFKQMTHLRNHIESVHSIALRLINVALVVENL